MIQAADYIEGEQGSPILLIADHASNRIPDALDLGIAAALLDDHVAIDIGVAPMSRALAHRLGCAAILATASRLVVDLNRDPDDPAVVPASSDGHVISGNAAIDAAARAARVDRYWKPYHALIAGRIDALRPRLLLSLHSFTPRLTSRPDDARPWEIGILYNRDDRAARLAIPLLRAAGIVTGDNEPYSGRLLNATMNRHAERRGLPYLGIEVRQDLIDRDAGVEDWASRLESVIRSVAAALA